MPELPEVETVRGELEPLVAGRRISAVEVRRPDIVGWPDAGAFIAGTKGGRIVRVARRGKYLVLELDSGRRLVIHLRLSGHLRVVSSRSAPLRYERVRFVLGRGRALCLVEPRALGRVYLVGPDRDFAAALATTGTALRGMLRMGPEPVSSGFTARFLAGRLAGRRAAIKSLLLDQSVCCGVGNIYADEALFRAGIHPERPAGGLTRAEVRRLAAGLRRVLSDGIRWCGTTLGDGRYRRPGDRPGDYQRHLRVYGRAGEPCRRRGCRETVRRVRVGGRGSSYCPGCQPAARGRGAA